MSARENEYSIVTRSAAKVNLTLDVVGLRPDGYHELRSIVHSVGIWDTLRFRFSGDGLRLTCENRALQTDDNLCLKAARLWEKSADRVLDCAIALEKTIPTGAGLGGGSGNAAAVLRTLNRHFDGALSGEKLHEIAAQLGADVPLFLHGGCALIEGIGEKITPLRTLEGWLVVAQPPQKLSTPQVFRAFDDLEFATQNVAQTRSDATQNISNYSSPNRTSSSRNSSAKLRERIENGADLSSIARFLSNDLTRAAEVCGVDLREGLNVLHENSALGAAMSGSGSAFFGVFHNESAAQNALEKLRQNGVWNFSQVAPLVSRGIEIGVETSTQNSE